ncbi:hypothetical protein Avbf_08978, partial [Armadillidium vulgare]
MNGLLSIQIKEETFKMECEVEEQTLFSEISKSKYPLVLMSKLSSNILQKYMKKKKDRKENLSNKNLKAKIVVRKKKSLGNPVRTIPKKLKLGEIPLDVKINNKIPLKNNTSPHLSSEIGRDPGLVKGHSLSSIISMTFHRVKRMGSINGTISNDFCYVLKWS